MKQVMDLFKLTPEHKKTLAAIGALCGVKQDAVLLVLEYVAYSSILTSLDGGEKGKVRFSIPLIGDAIFDVETEETEMTLAPGLKKLAKDALAGDVDGLKKYFEHKWLSSLTEEIENA